VYGFNHGVMSYALKDDGTAFLGKDGHGRIYLSGEKAQIYSANWLLKNTGMLLDVDDGYIKIVDKKETGYKRLDITTKADFNAKKAEYTPLYYYSFGGLMNENLTKETATYIPNGFNIGYNFATVNARYNPGYWYISAIVEYNTSEKPETVVVSGDEHKNHKSFTEKTVTYDIFSADVTIDENN